MKKSIMLFVSVIFVLALAACGVESPAASPTAAIPTAAVTPPIPDQFYGGWFQNVFSLLSGGGTCKDVITIWATTPGVLYRTGWASTDVVDGVAVVTHRVYPVVLVRDLGGTTWVVDFGFSPPRVYVQDDDFQWEPPVPLVQALDPAPFVSRAEEILPDHSPVLVTAEWRWQTEDGGHLYEWVAVSAACQDD